MHETCFGIAPLIQFTNRASPDEARRAQSLSIVKCNYERRSPPTHETCFGGRSRDDWIRTSDPFVPNEVRYRTALHPEVSKVNNVSEVCDYNFKI